MKPLAYKIAIYLFVVALISSVSVWVLGHNKAQTRATLDSINGGTEAYDRLQIEQIEKQWIPAVSIALSVIIFFAMFLPDLRKLLGDNKERKYYE
jgi:hypothetical protein